MKTHPSLNAMRSLPLDRFIWNKQDGTLVAEASDFGAMRDGLWWMQQIFNDACDVGIAIESHSTGKVQRFHLSHEDIKDGDLRAWEFTPVAERFQGTSPVRKVVIFND